MRVHARKMIMKLKEKIQSKIKIKPNSMEDYFEFKYNYVAKSLFLIVPIIIIGGVLFYFLYGKEWIERKYLTVDVFTDQEKVETYSGKVNLYNRENGRVVFQGRLEEGAKIEKGKAYYENGVVYYDGMFANNVFEGNGKMYNEKGDLIYEGVFANGFKEGNGIEYNTTHRGVVYKGGFSASNYEGEGTLYYGNGNIAFKGSFSAGAMEGSGIHYYKNGKTKYEGNFANGKYEGDGTLYNEKGKISYKGNFKSGAFEGEGKLCDEDLLYEGMFTNGLKHGQGIYYYKGIKFYEGEFYEDKMQGNGIIYSKDSNVIYEGNLVNNKIPVENALSKETTYLLERYKEEVEYLMFDENFFFINNSFQHAFLMNYADFDYPAKVQKIYIFPQKNECKALDRIEKISKDELIALEGEPTSSEIVRIGMDTRNIVNYFDNIKDEEFLVLSYEDEALYEYFFERDKKTLVFVRIEEVSKE
ncbi:MAG: hypothetical protein N4A62_20495 [Marinisporobacter sp.]|jgi:antitoxin component YwqK of YwqJK toxin-antitoxin module|nr:hypothetical protein [Marinisporobacter sp.]